MIQFLGYNHGLHLCPSALIGVAYVTTHYKGVDGAVGEYSIGLKIDAGFSRQEGYFFEAGAAFEGVFVDVFNIAADGEGGDVGLVHKCKTIVQASDDKRSFTRNCEIDACCGRLYCGNVGLIACPAPQGKVSTDIGFFNRAVLKRVAKL